MKFSSTLQFNAVPDWRDNYIDYDDLKKLIFRLERAAVPAYQDEEDSIAGQDPVEVFTKALDKEVVRVAAFYDQIEGDVMHAAADLRRKIVVYQSQYRDNAADSDAGEGRPSARRPSGERAGSSLAAGAPSSAIADEPAADEAVAGEAAESDDDSSDDEAPRRRTSKIHEELVQKRSIPFENVSLRREITRVYVLLNETLSYSDLNREGVRKALKKFDKVHGTDLLRTYMPKLANFSVFSDAANHAIGAHIDYFVDAFANLVGTTSEAASETLSGLLREHVVYERNTVWRELIGLERQTEGLEPQKKRKWRFVVCGIQVTLGRRALFLIGISLLFPVSLGVPLLASPVQSRCLSMVLLASLLWATETLPLFVTGLLIPVLAVVLEIPLNSDGVPMTAKEASAFVFSKMWSPVIAVLLGGFTLAAALSKHGIAKALAQSILGRVGTHSPRRVVLALMFVAAFLCMWISNVAAPVLLFSVAQPLLRLLPPGDALNKALILGIALASNVGGMASPIASPQNIIALQNMDPEPSWLEWFAVTLPVSTLSIVAVWGFLCLSFPVSREAREGLSRARNPGTNPTEFGFKQYYIIVVSIVTILLWCFSHQLEPVFGDMGVLALLPVVLLFGPGVLSAADFNNFLWTIVGLAMGGIVLGQCVESCGLLATVAQHIESHVSHLPLFAICASFGLAILVVASFISHTVAALIVLPLVKSIGEQLNVPHPRLLVMLAAMLCSGAMALPTSGFPNVTAVCMIDELGKPYLSAVDFVKRGAPASLIVYVVVMSVGYIICRALGF